MNALRAAIPAALAALALTLTGCAGTDDADAQSATSAARSAANGGHTSPREMADGLGAEEADGVFPRTVHHVNGQTVVETEPKRIAIISTGQLDAALTLGVVPVAAAVADTSELVPTYLTDAFPQDAAALDAMVNIGNRTEPDIEALAAAKPDLIFMNAAVLDEDFYEAISKIAPTVVTVGQGNNWKSDWLLFADALGKEGEAQDFLDTFHSDAQAYADAHPDGPTVSFLQSTGDRTRVMGVPSLSGGIAEDLGLGRPESQQIDELSLDISAEQLDLADADWIFYAGAGSGIQLITDAPLWPTLAGVAEGHAVEVDFDPFYMNTGPTASRLVLDTLMGTIA